MICPQCRAEYKEGIERCPDCDLPLVDKLPPEVHDENPFESVLDNIDVSALPVIHSLLDGAGIPYIVQGEEAFGLLPIGGASGWFGEHGIAVHILVPQARAEEARALLASGVDAEEGTQEES